MSESKHTAGEIMTDEQINRVIAESLESYGGLVAYRPRPMMGSVSKSKAWEADANREWYARDFMGDPAMRDLLQAKLLEEGFTITMAWLPDRQIGKLKRTNCVSMHLGKGIGSGEREFHIYDTRERIWPLAWIRAHNLTAGGEL